ncbi:MoaD/ThiS family protein [Propionivibrio dicarboxylicus]|uniref:Molybdopterin synthase sulfur carrier subunit n=1 Tax=Propionivibrio dicarboxylicus TaxID=83767 RepID=A0A1G8KFY8_9RHOO|nr:MoaD/ThiS family protein [Propionivibrio dicarboxylicus]SDI42308.1 molybdopterin synthase sulfur carrier subunit [Propionivibrio dicarboxylicus]
MIKVLFFGPVADTIGQRSIDIEYRIDMSLQDLRESLAQRFPQAFGIVAFTAVNGVQTRNMRQLLADRSEIAFMAKFSGG